MSLKKKSGSVPPFSCRITGNERGFFTIAGLCLLLAVALCIQGVQEFEGNYSTDAAEFRAEYELQNAADSALIEAFETGADSLEKTVASEYLGKITVKVYSREAKVFDKKDGYVPKDKLPAPKKDGVPATVLLSVAQCDNKILGGKPYRRALAYVLDGKIFFVNDFSYSDPIYDRQE